jgi:hypothetical protein
MPSGGIYAGLSERIEFERSLDPRIAVFVRISDRSFLMGVAPMHARFQAAISPFQFVRWCAPSTKPEIALRRTAGKNDMCKLLYFLTERRVGRIANTRSPIGFASSDGDQDILPGPSTLRVDLL